MAFLSKAFIACVLFGPIGLAIEQPPADARFIQEAAQNSIFEIQMGELAQLRSSSDQVKQYGTRMASDYGTILEQLRSFAAKNNFALPGDMGPQNQSIMDLLTEISGPVPLSEPAFDRVYVSEIIGAHKVDIAALREESASGSRADLREFAASAIPVVEEHLHLARTVENYLGAMSQVVEKNKQVSAQW